MTVSYNAETATTSGFGCFVKLLFRWRASVYKLVWVDLLIFLLAYYTLNVIYRFLLNPEQKYVFECVAYYCDSYSSLIPILFVLGFFVSIIIKRWWDQYMTLPWPDPIAVYVSSLVLGQDEHGRVMRRTIMRYVCLCLTMIFTQIAPAAKKRFPTHLQLVEAGLLTENEMENIKNLDEKFPKYPKHFMPIVWATSIVKRARKEGRIRDDFSLKTIVDELDKFRAYCDILLRYDWISIPLVYTQVVTWAVYSYFLGSIMGKQWTEKPDEDGFFNPIDQYFPIFIMLEFFFFMGWLKVAETLISPFGEDDDDYEVNWLIDRNLQVSYLIVDEMHHEHPELIKDQYWDKVFPDQLPYPDNESVRDEPPVASTAKWDPDYMNPVAAKDSKVRLLWQRASVFGKFSSSGSSITAVTRLEEESDDEEEEEVEEEEDELKSDELNNDAEEDFIEEEGEGEEELLKSSSGTDYEYYEDAPIIIKSSIPGQSRSTQTEFREDAYRPTQKKPSMIDYINFKQFETADNRAFEHLIEERERLRIEKKRLKYQRTVEATELATADMSNIVLVKPVIPSDSFFKSLNARARSLMSQDARDRDSLQSRTSRRSDNASKKSSLSSRKSSLTSRKSSLASRKSDNADKKSEPDAFID